MESSSSLYDIKITVFRRGYCRGSRGDHSIYGLQAGIYTRNITTALDAADKLEVGGVVINDIPSFRVDHMPYGGVKQSGTGREGIKYAMEEMLETKLIVIKR